MNRRLLRTTYHVEVEEVNFTHGLPDWLNETLTGSSTASTADYTDLYGSHYAMVARGRAGDGVTLRGAPLSTSVVKVLELEAVGVTVAGPAELTLGLGSYPEGNSAIQLGAVPGDAGVAEEGRVRLLLRDGNSYGERVLFAEGGDGQISGDGTVIEDVDLAVIANSETGTAQAHLGYSYVSCGPDGFPADQVLAPAIRTTLLAEGEASAKVRRLTIGIYS